MCLSVTALAARAFVSACNQRRFTLVLFIYVVVFDIVVVSCVVRKGEFPSMTDCSRYCIACTTLCCFMLQC